MNPHTKVIKYNKLVRDRIPEIIESHGKSCETVVLSDSDYKTYLYKKLTEEVNEFLDDDNLEELADITEVIHAILRLKDSTPEDLEIIRREKNETRGRFDKRILLTTVFE